MDSDYLPTYEYGLIGNILLSKRNKFQENHSEVIKDKAVFIKDNCFKKDTHAYIRKITVLRFGHHVLRICNYQYKFCA